MSYQEKRFANPYNNIAPTTNTLTIKIFKKISNSEGLDQEIEKVCTA